MFHALFGTPAVILRPSYAYGPGQEKTKLIPYVTTALLAGESPELSTGARPIDWVYAGDVARAYVAAATAEGVEGRTLDIGSGVEASVTEVVEAIVEAVGPDAGAAAVRPRPRPAARAARRGPTSRRPRPRSDGARPRTSRPGSAAPSSGSASGSDVIAA